MRPLYYGMDGQPISREEMARLYENSEARVVARTELPGERLVSTVLLAIDHQYGEGPPLIFETMVFGAAGEEECRRYSTREEALAGHAEVVAKHRSETLR